MKNGRWPQKKWKWKTTSILRQSCCAYLTTKTSKTNGFDTIEIDLVNTMTGVITYTKDIFSDTSWTCDNNALMLTVYTMTEVIT